MIANKRIDEKHHIAVLPSEPDQELVIKIIKTTNGQPIPEEEPIILFRGRDRLALPMLKHYRQLCVKDGATEYQLASMDTMILKFQQFEQNNPHTMKQPGSTMGK